MTKPELINAIATKAGLSGKEAGAALAALTDAIVEALKEDDKVTLTGFGSFEVHTRAARIGRNPGTGEKVEIAEKKLPVFRAGKALKDAVE